MDEYLTLMLRAAGVSMAWAGAVLLWILVYEIVTDWWS